MGHNYRTFIFLKPTLTFRAVSKVFNIGAAKSDYLSAFSPDGKQDAIALQRHKPDSEAQTNRYLLLFKCSERSNDEAFSSNRS